jgi:hypothetical protein
MSKQTTAHSVANPHRFPSHFPSKEPNTAVLEYICISQNETINPMQDGKKMIKCQLVRSNDIAWWNQKTWKCACTVYLGQTSVIAVEGEKNFRTPGIKAVGTSTTLHQHLTKYSNKSMMSLLLLLLMMPFWSVAIYTLLSHVFEHPLGMGNINGFIPRIL